MKFMIGYGYTEADKTELRETLAAIRKAFEARGHKVFIMIEDVQRWNSIIMTKTEAVRRAIPEIKKCDAGIFLYRHHNDVSAGRSREQGFLFALGKPTVLALERPFETSEFEEAWFTENPANEKAELPSVVHWSTADELAAEVTRWLDRLARPVAAL